MPKTRVVPVAAADAVSKIGPQHVGDIVDTLNSLLPEAASCLLSNLPHERAVEVFDDPGLISAADIFRLLPIEQASRLLEEISADRATDLCET